MKLTINTPGTYLHKRGECFLLEKDAIKKEFAAKKVEQILITTRTAISTDAIELAIENNIDIVFLKSTGQPIARVWHSKLGSISTIRRKQLLLQDTMLGAEIVKEWVVVKMTNQIEHLKKLSMNRRDEKRKSLIKESVEQIKRQIDNVNRIKTSIQEKRDTIQGFEGTASRIYFQTLNELMPSQYKFNKRSRNPAQDEFNAMLNYGYGVLYSMVERACVISGLDPYIGIMHTDNYNKKSLVFDLIEAYRVHIDEVVFGLFATKKVKKGFFDMLDDGGFYLNKDGKVLLIGGINEKMQNKIKYKGRNIEIENTILFDCHNIANAILKEELSC